MTVAAVCPVHGQIMRTDTRAYASKRCYFERGQLPGLGQFCGRKTKIEVRHASWCDTKVGEPCDCTMETDS